MVNRMEKTLEMMVQRDVINSEAHITAPEMKQNEAYAAIN